MIHEIQHDDRGFGTLGMDFAMSLFLCPLQCATHPCSPARGPSVMAPLESSPTTMIDIFLVINLLALLESPIIFPDSNPVERA